MLIVRSANGVPIRLTDERWQHIVRRHPEMDGHRNFVLETLTDPDYVQEGDFGALLAVRLFPGAVLVGKYVIVVYRETDPMDGFVLTAYLARRPSDRRITIWRR
jgi:hypothetical protein